jgi:hypothetical protein
MPEQLKVPHGTPLQTPAFPGQWAKTAPSAKTDPAAKVAPSAKNAGKKAKSKPPAADTAAPEAEDEVVEVVVEETVTANHEELQQLASSSDPKDQELLQEFLRDNLESTRDLGDLHHIAEQIVHRLGVTGDPLRLKAIELETNDLRERLQGDNPSEWEKLAVNQAVLTDQAFYTLMARSHTDIELVLDPRWQKALDAAERRRQSALKSVELAKRMTRDEKTQPLRLLRLSADLA